TTWSAMKKWPNHKYLENHPDLQNIPVDISHQNTFQYIDPESPWLLAGLPGTLKKHNYETINTTVQAFFKMISDPNETRSFYHYGRVGPELRRDVIPFEFMWLHGTDLRFSRTFPNG